MFLRSLAFRLRQSHKVRPLSARSFHSPFVVLNAVPRKHNSSSMSLQVAYEKQMEHSSEPQTSFGGKRTYVVSEPDLANNPYDVPSGMHPIDTPYAHLNPAPHKGRFFCLPSHRQIQNLPLYVEFSLKISFNQTPNNNDRQQMLNYGIV
jgi:hypothetical protein